MAGGTNKKYPNPYEYLLYSDINDKMPPNDNEFEQIVLGAIMVNSEIIINVFDKIKPELFYDSRNRTIFLAIEELFREQSPISIVSVRHQLEKQGHLNDAGGSGYIVDITKMIGSAHDIEYHIKVLQQFFVRRELIASDGSELKYLYDLTTDVFELLEKRTEAQERILEAIVKREGSTPEELGKKLKDRLFTILHNDGKLLGAPSGITELDIATNGYQKGHFIVVGARPGMGKTGFLLTNAYNCILIAKKPVVIFSLEMEEEELMQRLYAMHTGVSVDDQNAGRFDSKLAYDVDKWIKDNFYDEKGNPLLIIDDDGTLNTFDIVARARRYCRQYNPAMILLDYMQLAVKGLHEDETKELSIMSKAFKACAKQFDIPFIALSQLNRDVEKGTNESMYRPQLKHLRQSGAIEEAADIVLFLYRQEYYLDPAHTDDKTTERFQYVKIKGTDYPCEGIAEIILAKYRNGKKQSVYTKFIHHTTQFVNLELEYGTAA